MDTIALIFSFVGGAVVGGYIVYLIKATILPADMDRVVSTAVSAIMQVQQIYGDSSITNDQKAAESLSITGKALSDAGIPVNAATLAVIIRVAYHTLKPEVKELPPATQK